MAFLWLFLWSEEPFLQDLVEEARIAGMALARVEKGLIRLESFGYLSAETKTSVTSESVFQAASLSKPVFAYLCMKLWDEKRIDLDKPLMTYFPNHRLKEADYAKQLTARHVLSHRSGLPNWGGGTLELSFVPGTEFRYSGEGYVYLGEVLEKLTGKPLNDLFQDYVFGPLKMENSSFVWRADFAGRIALPHDSALSPKDSWKPDKPNPAASLLTTAEDYSKFLIAVTGGKGLSEDAKVQMFRSQGSVFGSEDERSKKTDLGWGLGMGRFSIEGKPFHWHWGDNGDTKAFYLFRADEASGFVYFANSSEGLSITEALVTVFQDGATDPFLMLNYEQYDAPGRAARLRGEFFFTKGKLEEALIAYEFSFKENPENQGLGDRCKFIRDLLRSQRNPLEIKQVLAHKIVGQYGPRKILLDKGALYYQRGDRDPIKLIPVGDNRFGMLAYDGFQLEIELNKEGEPVALLGHYAGGNSDRNERDSE